MESTRAESGDRTAGSGWAARVGGGADDYLRGREGSENFPVALRLLPADVRVHLGAVYDVARVIDDLGDQAPGDRTALLRDFRADLATIWDDDAGPGGVGLGGAGQPASGGAHETADGAGEPTRGGAGEPNAPVLRRLAATVRAKHLSHKPFDDLVEANLVDQEVATYPTYEDLVEYCELSANPVGRIVLEVFEASTPERAELSDRICTALQIIEHCQDVAEDRRAGRIYLPLEDLTRFGVAEVDLDASVANGAVRRLVAFEAERAAALLNSGTPLLEQLHGWARLAVRGYVAGGGAALLALRRADWDVLSGTPQARKVDVLRQLSALVRGRRVGS